MLEEKIIADRIIYYISDLSGLIHDEKNKLFLNKMIKKYYKFLGINDVLNNNFYKIKKNVLTMFFYSVYLNDQKIFKKIYDELLLNYQKTDNFLEIHKCLEEDLKKLVKKMS